MIMDLQKSPDNVALLSASKDHTAKLFDAKTLQHLKTYQSERPVNSAAISPIHDHIVLGGGEEAMSVSVWRIFGYFDLVGSGYRTH